MQTIWKKFGGQLKKKGAPESEILSKPWPPCIRLGSPWTTPSTISNPLLLRVALDLHFALLAVSEYYFYTSTYRVEHSIPRPLARSDGLSILHQTLDLSYGLFCSPKTATLAAEEIVNGQSKMNCHCSLDLWSMGKDTMHRCQSSKKHRSTLAGSAWNVSHVYPSVCLNSGAWARTTL